MATLVTLVTRFLAGEPGEDRLDGLSMWLPQEDFAGFERVDYRFEYADDTIRCIVTDSLDAQQLAVLSSMIDAALRRIVALLEPRTTAE